MVVVVVLLVPGLDDPEPAPGVVVVVLDAPGAPGVTVVVELDEDEPDGSRVDELLEPDGSVVVVVVLDEPGTLLVPGVVEGGLEVAGWVVVVVDEVEPEPLLPLLSQAARPRAKAVALASSQILLCMSLSPELRAKPSPGGAGRRHQSKRPSARFIPRRCATDRGRDWGQNCDMARG